MFLDKRAQSIAEYAIVLGLVVAVAAGVLSGILKGGIRGKQSQAMRLLEDAGNTQLPTAQSGLVTYDQEYSQSELSGVEDTSVLHKGGAEARRQTQTSETQAISIETINATDTTQ